MSNNAKEIILQGQSADGQTEETIDTRLQLLDILNSATKLYLDMLRINLELKRLPTERAGIITDVATEVM